MTNNFCNRSLNKERKKVDNDTRVTIGKFAKIHTVPIKFRTLLNPAIHYFVNMAVC